MPGRLEKIMDSKIIFWAFVRQFATRGVHHQKRRRRYCKCRGICLRHLLQATKTTGCCAQRLPCVRIPPADNNDAVDVIASRLRHLQYLRQVVLRATLTVYQPSTLGAHFAPNFPKIYPTKTRKYRPASSGNGVIIAILVFQLPNLG